MKTSTKLVLIVWVAIGLPVTYVINFWADTLWIPFPPRLGENFSYYIAWSIAFTLIFVLPLFLVWRFMIWLIRLINRE